MTSAVSCTSVLSNKKLVKIPDEILLKCNDIQILDLSLNRGMLLDGTIERFQNLTKLHLSQCGLKSLPDGITQLTKLEELDLNMNEFYDGLSPTIGLLTGLKKLSLNCCQLKHIPNTIEKLTSLEELNLSNNNFSDGLCASIGQLFGLKKLYLLFCGLQFIPGWIGNLPALEDLDLRVNDFSNNALQSIGQLSKLKRLNLGECRLSRVPEGIGTLKCLKTLLMPNNKFTMGLNSEMTSLQKLQALDLKRCQLTEVPDWIGDLKNLKDLNLMENMFFNGLHPNIGKLVKLKKLNLKECKLTEVNESLGSLHKLGELNLACNNLKEYPGCTLAMKSLRTLDLSNNAIYAQSTTEGNCIKQLPVSLATTQLQELKLERNQVTEPPQEVWSLGLDAIKRYMRSIIAGEVLMIPDTINIIGDTGAGKTSIAKSLIANEPRTTTEDDSTRVMQQLRVTIDESSGHSVNINDFGGHEIYRSVMPIFLPANGLIILVLDMTKEIEEKDIKEWLLTAIAKSEKYRIIIAGTHKDKVKEPGKNVPRWIARMEKQSSNIMKLAISEVEAHIYSIESRKDKNQVSDKLYSLLSNLKDATIRVVTVSCKVLDGSLKVLRDNVQELLLPPQKLPISWFRMITDIFKQSHYKYYLKMEEIIGLSSLHLTENDDDITRITILHYLVKTGQIIWDEHHSRLKDIVFQCPQKVIDACKKVLHHDVKTMPLHLKNERTDYQHGILREPLLKALVEDSTFTTNSDQKKAPAHCAWPFEDAETFLLRFNLISRFSRDDAGDRYIIPCKLRPDEPPELTKFKEKERATLNRVKVKLSFIGSLVPLSFFETSLTEILNVVWDLNPHPVVRPWKRGMYCVYGGVHLLAELRDDSICLTAYAEQTSQLLWTVLSPVFERLNENVSKWHGAPPTCFLICPLCAHDGRTSQQCEIEVDLTALAGLRRKSNVGLTCHKCFELIPQYLCFPPDTHDGVRDREANNARAIPSENRPPRELHFDLEKVKTNFQKQYSELIHKLTINEVRTVAAKLYSDDLLLKEEKDKILLVGTTETEAATKLIDCISTKSTYNLFKKFMQLLRDELRRDDIVTALIS